MSERGAWVASRSIAETYRLAGDLYTILVGGNATEERFAWLEALIAPGNEIPPHYHEHEREAFYVTEGRLTFRTEGTDVEAKAGTAMHFPIGVVHSVENRGNTPARALVQVTPAGFERMIVECGRLVGPDEGPSAPNQAETDQLVKLAPRYGIRLVEGESQPAD